jgi:hypothetical protein
LPGGPDACSTPPVALALRREIELRCEEVKSAHGDMLASRALLVSA